jgi:cytochrome P450
MDILIAGADTTASTLTAGLLHILADEKIQYKLVRALQDVESNKGILPLLELEKINYLVIPSLSLAAALQFDLIASLDSLCERVP